MLRSWGKDGKRSSLLVGSKIKISMYNEDWECFHCQMSNHWQRAECYWCKKPKTTENENRVSVYAPAPDNADNFIISSNYNRGISYEMKQIYPTVGKNPNKYRWFICTPNFPSEQYKINDPHCHAWPDDKKGEARISLDPTTHEPTKFKVKWGKIKETDQTEIKKLVKENKELIYKEWEEEWIGKM